MGGGSKRSSASLQAYLTPETPPVRPPSTPGDGFTAKEIRDFLKPNSVESWYPAFEYADREISDLSAGPNAVTFMGRVANIFDLANTPKTPRSAKGCIKLVVKDGKGAITVRLWYASHMPYVRIGSLVSIWTNHVSDGGNGTLSSSQAPLFASLFPERDRNCHLMVHENSDDGRYKCPLHYVPDAPLNGLMTLQSFINGGYEVTDAKIVVVVKSIGAKKSVIRKDQSTTENINLQIHDDTAEATFGLWGTMASSPAASPSNGLNSTSRVEASKAWKPDETVLLLQAPGWKFGRATYLSVNARTLVDVDPDIPDADWLRRWALRRKSRGSINPSFPEHTFDVDMVEAEPVRCLYTIGELDEFARCSPLETCRGYLSVLIMEVKLLEYWKRDMLLSGECCNIPIYANSLTSQCKRCDKDVQLRLNPRVIGQVIDETAVIGPGKLLFSDQAWYELLGRNLADLLKLGFNEIKHLSDRMLFCRVTLLFGWTGDESTAAGRICVIGVRS